MHEYDKLGLMRNLNTKVLFEIKILKRSGKIRKKFGKNPEKIWINLKKSGNRMKFQKKTIIISCLRGKTLIL